VPLPVTTDPRHILVAGDWHGHLHWGAAAIRRWVPAYLADEPQRIFLQLGDFGIWPGLQGSTYLAGLGRALGETEASVLFLDGNHEDFTKLRLPDGPWPSDPGRVRIRDRITWMPRGHRWQWHGRTWLAVGGAVSPDRATRTEGRNWWPGEEITDEQEAAVIAAGPADVLVSHDCPAGVIHSFPDPPSWWEEKDLARSDEHRQRLQRIVDAVQPRYVIHGHLHRAYQREGNFGYGPVQVTGLSENGTRLNCLVLDVRQMKWKIPPP
jgi:hypothetical protein